MVGLCGDRGGSPSTGPLGRCPSARCDRQPGGEDVVGGTDIRVCLMPAAAAVEARFLGRPQRADRRRDLPALPESSESLRRALTSPQTANFGIQLGYDRLRPMDVSPANHPEATTGIEPV